MQIRRISSFEDYRGLKEVWNNLHDHSDSATIFQSWQWNWMWSCIVLTRLKGALPAIRVVEDDFGTIQAILPFFEKPLGGIFGLVQLLGHRMSYHNDILMRQTADGELPGTVVQLMLDSLESDKILHLRHLDEASPFTRRLAAAGYAHPQCARLTIELDASASDPWNRLGKSRRSRARWAINHLKREYQFTFRVSRAQELGAAFDRLVALHHLRFRSQRRSSSLTGATVEFLKAICCDPTVSEGFEILELVADGEAVASILLAVDRNRCFSIQGGFHPDFGKFSPMRLLIGESMRRAFEQHGCRTFDLGPGYEPYKYDWHPCAGTNYSCCRSGASLLARTASALYDRAFRFRLPEYNVS